MITLPVNIPGYATCFPVLTQTGMVHRIIGLAGAYLNTSEVKASVSIEVLNDVHLVLYIYHSIMPCLRCFSKNITVLRVGTAIFIWDEQKIESL